jgi:AraC-like DNA-binding protein
MLIFDVDRPNFVPYGLRCDQWQPILMNRPDRHNEIEVNFLEQGSVTYLLAGHKVTVNSNRLALFWAAVPHQIISFEGRHPYYVLTIPLACFLSFKISNNLKKTLLHGHCVQESDAQRAPLDLAIFKTWLEDFQSSILERHRVALLEVEGRLARLAQSLPDETAKTQSKGIRSDSRRDGCLSKVEQIAAFIAQHYAEPLTVQNLSEGVGLHPNYVMSLFQSAFGTTLISYLTEMRVMTAQRLLVTTDDTIATIAFASGFNSISRFNAAFKAICGCSPRDYQKTYQLG